jgi:voltage-gated potassium channel
MIADGTVGVRGYSLAVLRVVASIAVLVTAYYLLPFDRSATWAAVALLVVGLVLLMGVIALQVRLIIRSPFPRMRAVEALAFTVPLFLVLFAGTYFVMDRLAPGSFGTPLTRTDALYFTVTVFSTVGFGDITAKTETARLVVTGQMIADVLILGVGIKIILGAVTRGQRRRQDARDPQSG